MAKARTPATTVRPNQKPRIIFTIESPKATAGKIAKADFEQWVVELLQVLADFGKVNRTAPSGIHSAGFRKQVGKPTMLELWLWASKDIQSTNRLRRTDKRFDRLPPQVSFKDD